MTAPNRSEALTESIATLDARYGVGCVRRLSDAPPTTIAVIPTGYAMLDTAIGIGGYPCGRVVEVFGPPTARVAIQSLALQAIAECQCAGGIAALIDVEHTLDIDAARKIGVDLGALLVAQPDNGEQALDIAEALAKSGAVDLIVVDSVASLIPQAEIAGDSEALGMQVRLMSQALRKITAIAHRTNTIVLFINETRQKIGVTFGNGEVCTGGNALKYYSSLRLDVRNVAEGIRVRVVKNKLAPPFATAVIGGA